MPRAPVPAELVEFLRLPRAAVIGTVRPDGSPHTVETWYDWDDGHVLVNMEASRSRLRHMREDPRVSLTVLDSPGNDRHVTLRGVVDRIEPDEGLEGIDRLALRYAGERFGRRDAERVNAWIRVDAWHAWDGGGPWVTGLT